MFAILLACTQCLLTFILCVTCAGCGKSKDDDSSDDEEEDEDLHKYEDEERQGLNDY